MSQKRQKGRRNGARSAQEQAGRVRGRAVSGSEKDRYCARGPREKRGPQMTEPPVMTGLNTYIEGEQPVK